MRKLPNWIAAALRVAGILHIFLAAAMVFFSHTILAGLQTSAPHIPSSDWWIELSGLGLLVIGTGYFVSSFKPSRNAVPLLMGLLSHAGMLLFLMIQLGFAGLQSPVLAWSLALMLAWTMLGVFMLIQISKSRSLPQTLAHSYTEPLAKTLSRFRTQKGKNLLQLSNKQPIMLIFLRDFACPFCRKALDDILRKKTIIEEEGTRLVFVHLGEEEQAQAYFGKAALEEEHRISDPSGIMYSAFGLSSERLVGQSPWRSWRRNFAAYLYHRGIGPAMGDGLHMPAIFLINQGEIIKSYRHGRTSSKPDYGLLASCEAA